MRRGLPFILLTMVMYTPMAAQSEGSLSTVSVVQGTMKAIPNCLHYRVVGMCYWVVCDPLCQAVSTLKVDHYLPDVVVSVYRGYHTNPWEYADQFIDPSAYKIGQAQIKMHLGYGNETLNSPHDQETHFKEVDIVGNPALPALKVFKYALIPSVAKAFMPYYASLADAYLWRSPLIEMKRYSAYLLPGVHIVGSLFNHWGSIYPRTGFIVQPQDAKAAAVIAERAADIVTHLRQAHIYHYLPSDSCGPHCKVAQFKENDQDTKWQMIYPLAEKACTVFGEQDLAQNTPWGEEASLSTHGNYVWILWRRYQGCIPVDGTYLSSINFRGNPS